MDRHGHPRTSDARLRVAFVVPTFEVGGLQRAIATISRHVDRERAIVDVIALRPSRPSSTVMHDQLSGVGGTVHELGLTGRAERDPRALATAVARLRKVLAAGRYDIVDSAVLEADLVSRLATVGLPTAHVTHLINLTHDPRTLPRDRARHAWTPTAARWVDRSSSHLSVHFVAITHAVSRSAQRTLGIPAAKITVVERGVDADRFRPQPPPRGAVLRVLCVGRLEPSKDHATGVLAIAALRRRGIDATLTIAGRGPLAGHIEQTINAQQLEDRVRVIEPVNNVEKLYAAHDVFLFPSRWEGLGNAAIEAMASGRPVVATDLDVLHEVLGDLGRFAPERNAERFADELAHVRDLSTADYAALSEALRARAIERFDPAETTSRLLRVYQDVARSRT